MTTTPEQAIDQAHRVFLAGFCVTQLERDKELLKCADCLRTMQEFAGRSSAEFMEMKSDFFHKVTPNAHVYLIMATFKHACVMADVCPSIRCEKCR